MLRHDRAALAPQPIFIPVDKNTSSKLLLLRLSNSLLRRLSPVHDTGAKRRVLAANCCFPLLRSPMPALTPRMPELCGRILMLLASVFPLSERSGVNPTGTFNADNTTTAEDEATAVAVLAGDADAALPASGPGMDVDGEPDRPVLDYTLYRKFWGIQGAFASPTAAAVREEWVRAVDGLSTLFTAFEGHPLESAGRAGRARDAGAVRPPAQAATASLTVSARGALSPPGSLWPST